jgi:hypothetical protein
MSLSSICARIISTTDEFQSSWQTENEVASFRADHLVSDNGFTTLVFSFMFCNNLDHLHGDAEKNT